MIQLNMLGRETFSSRTKTLPTPSTRITKPLCLISAGSFVLCMHSPSLTRKGPTGQRIPTVMVPPYGLLRYDIQLSVHYLVRQSYLWYRECLHHFCRFEWVIRCSRETAGIRWDLLGIKIQGWDSIRWNGASGIP